MKTILIALIALILAALAGCTTAPRDPNQAPIWQTLAAADAERVRILGPENIYYPGRDSRPSRP